MAKGPQKVRRRRSDGVFRRIHVKGRLVVALVVVAWLALVRPAAHGQDGELKSGPDKRMGGPFDVKAITGEMKGKTLCYV
jgi:hypothetical protein